MHFLSKIKAKYAVTGAKEDKKLSGLSVKLWDDVYKIGAEHWGNASSPIFQWLNDSKKWEQTQYQVASFGHSPEKALRQIIEDSLIGVEIDENIEEEIDEAIRRAKDI
jgi:hypothetical protein